MVLGSYQSPLAGESGMLLGCRDGYIRAYDRHFGHDDGSAFTSDIWYGPVRLSGSDYEDGMLEELVAGLAKDSGSVNWALYVGDTAEIAKKSMAAASGTWNGQLSYTQRPKLRGVSAYIRLTGASNVPWSVESMNMVRRSLGRRRKL
jgi:hypothetical protein